MSTPKKKLVAEEPKPEEHNLIDETQLSQAYRNCAYQLSQMGFLLQDLRHLGDPTEDATWDAFEVIEEQAFHIRTAIRDAVSAMSEQHLQLRQLYRQTYAEKHKIYPGLREVPKNGLLPRLSSK